MQGGLHVNEEFEKALDVIQNDTCDVIRAECSGNSPGNLPFSEFLRFQSNALEFSNCQVHGRTCRTR